MNQKKVLIVVLCVCLFAGAVVVSIYLCKKVFV